MNRKNCFEVKSIRLLIVLAIVLSPASLIAQSSTGSAMAMSADQIVTILQNQPNALAIAREAVAQSLGADPANITDQDVYDRIRQDPNLRQQATEQLEEQGYSVGSESGSQSNPVSDTSNSAGEQMPSPDLAPEASQSNYSSQGSYPDQRNSNASSLRQSGYPHNPQGTVPAGPDGNAPSGVTNRQTNLAPRMPSAGNYPPSGTFQGIQEDEPQVRQLHLPYTNVPSLPSLYSQILPESGKLRRFGSEMFKFGTGNVNELPMDLPVGPDYVLGPGDNLVINMWGGHSERLNRTIDRQGEVALPEAGTISVSGMTLAEAQKNIQNALSPQFEKEQVEISLGRVRTVRIYVVGDVQRPGAYDVSSLSTPLNALYAAGGPTDRGSLRTLKQFRGNQLVREIDLYDFLLHGVRSDLDRLIPGDTILVPPVGPQVSISGMIRRPAIYELKGEESLADVLKMAGGVLVSANLKGVKVDRVIAHERHTMLSVQIAGGSDAALPSFPVEDGDAIQVMPILPYNNKVVYLEGHVYEPGPYPWKEGMTVTDLAHSYEDIMPEPADHAEVVRLQPPDFRPETISFDLPDLLAGNDVITLQPFDVVRIYGRYDIDPPRVSIYGEVLRPGEYPMSQGLTVTGLVRMAGGFRRSAYREEADLSSYKVQDGEKVLIGHSVVAIQKALAGNRGSDVVLQPGDVVGIRQLTGWNDIGSSITVKGEVVHPGTYGIEEGERLSSVLKRAGGFRDGAYPAGSVLERVAVRQVEETNRQDMIHRVESTLPNVSAGVGSSTQDQQNLLQTMREEQQDVLTALRNHPSTGRLVIKINTDITKWQNTSFDVVVRKGDTITIPKRPDFVLISGQVYNPTGIAYRPGKEAGWYLHQAGGVTRSGDRKNIYILRADGSVVANQKNLFSDSGILNLRMNPGDSVIVPEKIIGGSQLWRNLIGTAQIMSSVALTGAVSGAW